MENVNDRASEIRCASVAAQIRGQPPAFLEHGGHSIPDAALRQRFSEVTGPHSSGQDQGDRIGDAQAGTAVKPPLSQLQEGVEIWNRFGRIASLD